LALGYFERLVNQSAKPPCLLPLPLPFGCPLHFPIPQELRESAQAEARAAMAAEVAAEAAAAFELAEVTLSAQRDALGWWTKGAMRGSPEVR
jgi:hypothetical protein